MNKLAVGALAAAMLIVSGFAWATLFDVTGKIRSVDIANHYLRLADGEYYKVPPDIDLGDLKVGDLVTLSVHDYHDGVNRVARIAKIEDQRQQYHQATTVAKGSRE